MFITGSGLGRLRAAAQSRCTAVRLWKNKNGTLHNASLSACVPSYSARGGGSLSRDGVASERH